ncbi:MAG: hypothetical protein ACTHN5_05745 [Phycisphaerae bacterium]
MTKRTYIAYLVAAAVGVGGYAGQTWAADAGQNMQGAGQSFQNAGQNIANGAAQAGQGIAQGVQRGARDLKSDLSNAADNVQTNAKLDDLKDRVAKLLDASASKGDLDDVKSYVDKDAQSRLKDLKADSTLKQDLKQLKDDYKSHYNKDLSFTDDTGKLFNNSQCVEGKVKDPSQLQQWPVQSQGRASFTSYGGNSNSSPKDIKKGDHIAVIELQSSSQGSQGNSQIQGTGTFNQNQQNRQSATISAVKQDGDWRVYVPQSLDANTLQSNLKNEVQQVLNQKAQWPSDADQARQLIATHVLKAYYESGSGQNGMQEAGNRD